MAEQSEGTPISTTPPEKREILYGKVEQKISLGKRLWTEARSLSVPSGEDSEDLGQLEQQQLDRIYQAALVALPEAAAKYNRIQEIQSIQSEREARIAQQKRRRFNEYYDDKLPTEEALLEDNDVRFIRTLQRGTTEAVQKREKLRQELKEYGEGQQLIAVHEADFPEKFRGRVKYVIPKNFSFNFVVRRGAFENYRQRTKNPRVEGFHVRGGHFSYLREPRSSLELAIFGEETDYDKKVKVDFEETLSHEDFHSFMDGFLPPEKDFQGFISLIQRDANSYRRHKELDAPKFVIERILRRLKGKIAVLADRAYEELLAELASTTDRVGIPRSTFAGDLIKKSNHLDNMLVGLDPEIDDIIRATKAALDLQFFRKKVEKLFKEVKDKVPEKLEDLEIAFALFPPSQIRHIEGLVGRWTQAA